MDLTEICHPQITKLSGSESKNHLIMASNGSLISAGKQRATQPSVASVSHRVVNDLLMICCYIEIVTHVSLIPGSADSEVSEEQKKEKVAELKKKEKELQEKLAKKLEELKKICLREAVSFPVVLLLVSDTDRSVKLTSCFDLQELTGQLPKEYPLAAGEKAPHVRRRVGTAFKLDDLFPYDEVVTAVKIYLYPSWNLVLSCFSSLPFAFFTV